MTTRMTLRLKAAAAATATALGLAAASSQAQAAVTLINVFEVPAGRLDAAIDAWERARDFLAEEPGYLDTALHQALTSDARFQLINIARWESPQAFQAAIRWMQDSGIFPPVEGLTPNPALYSVIRSDAARP